MAARLAHMVELFLREIAAAHPGEHEPVARIQRHEAALERGTLLSAPAPAVGQRLQPVELARQGLVGGLLQPGIEAGAHHEPIRVDVVITLIRPGDQPFP